MTIYALNEIRQPSNYEWACPLCNTPNTLNSAYTSGSAKSIDRVYCTGCGIEFRGAVDPGRGAIDLTPTGEKQWDTWVLLRHCTPPENPAEQLYIVVEGNAWGKIEDGPDLDDAYYYNEHTCPTNFLRVGKVVWATDTDQHGVFMWVQSIVVPDQATLLALFEEHDWGTQRPGIVTLDDLPWEIMLVLFDQLPAISTDDMNSLHHQTPGRQDY